MDTTLIVPGLHGSGHDHWQTWFERQIPDCIRVMQSDWSEPDLPKWSAKLRRELSRAPGRVYVVAHSFGCLAAVQAAFDYRESIDGLMLVAPADPARFGLSAAIPERPLGVPSVVIASTNDPWMSFRQRGGVVAGVECRADQSRTGRTHQSAVGLRALAARTFDPAGAASGATRVRARARAQRRDLSPAG